MIREFAIATTPLHSHNCHIKSREALMADVIIRCRPNGPFVIEGPVTVIDHNGNAFPLNPDKPSIALCRCGQSARRPFCDGTHKTCGFVAEELAPLPE